MTEVSGKTSMKFKLNARTQTIEGADPSVFLTVVGNERECGLEFLLAFHDKKIGFRTADLEVDDQTKRLGDGTFVWSIDRAFCQISRRIRGKIQRDVFATTYGCRSQEEVHEVISLFKEALSYYGGGLAPGATERGRSRVEFTPRLLSEIKRGAFVQ